MDISFIFPEYVVVAKGDSNVAEKNTHAKNTMEQNKVKSFADVVSTNFCDIPLSQFPTHYLKGDRLAICVKACKHNLHGRVIWFKGVTPLIVTNLRIKLLELWTSIGK